MKKHNIIAFAFFAAFILVVAMNVTNTKKDSQLANVSKSESVK